MGRPRLPADVERALHHAAVDRSDDAITIQDASGRLIYANASAARVLGYESPAALCAAAPAETISRFEVCYEDGRPVPGGDDAGLALIEGRFRGEVLLRFKRRDEQQERRGVLRSIPVHDDRGGLTHVINIFRDVTQQSRSDAYRKFLLRADEELTASTDYSKTLATVARLAVPLLADWCTVDLLDGTLKRVATAHIDPEKIALLEELERRYPPNASDAGAPGAIRTGQPVFVSELTREMLVASAKDAEHARLIERLGVCSFIAVPMKIRGTTLGVITFAMAESGRRYAEPDLEFTQALADRAALAIENARLLTDAQKARVTSEEAFRLMVESVKDYAIFRLDPKGYVTSWNAGAELIKGYRPSEIIGQHFSRFYSQDAVRAGHCDYELETAARVGRFEEEGWRVRKDGSHFWANVVITALRGPDGELKGFAKVTRDLTERKNAEEALRAEMNRRLDAEQTSHLAQLFIGVLGHDLRNPLSAIMTSASYLSRIATSEKQSRTAARVTSSALRMARMIEQLLDFTRFGIGGGIVLDLKRANLTDIFRNVIDELATARSEVAIRCDFMGDTSGSWDAPRLEQAVSNLIGNAVHHGTRDVPVSLRVDGRGDKIVVTLHNGGAIPPDVLANMFAPFKRLRKSTTNAASSGLGLGLYISNQIVRAHGGELHVDSNKDHGTTFVITLPRTAPAEIVESRNA